MKNKKPKNRVSMMKKLLVFTMFFSIFTTILPVQSVSAATEVVRTDGFITSYKANDTCGSQASLKDAVDAYAVKISNKPEQAEDTGFSISGILNNVKDLVKGPAAWLTENILDFVKDIIFDLIGLFNMIPEKNEDCTYKSAFEFLGLVNQLFVITKPVNVTNVSSLMSLAGMTIWLSVTILIFALLGYAYSLLKGQEEIEPMKYAVKFIGIFVLVYYAPYFVQDIIGLNNTIVHTFAAYNFTGIDGANLSLEYVLPFSIVAAMTGIGYSLTFSNSFVMIVLMLLAMIFLIAPLAKVIGWWYLRLFKLFIYTVVSPIMFATLIFPSMSKTGKNFLKSLITESFSQVFVVLGLLVYSAYTMAIPSVIEAVDGGIIGYLIAFYIGTKFLQDLPMMAESLIDGSIGGAGQAGVQGLHDRYNPAHLANKASKHLQERASRKAQKASAANASRVIRTTTTSSTKTSEKKTNTNDTRKRK